ncbi:endogenous retrovirus group K member 5 Gag polyprotein-like [Peromyscus californicus insignis]|uniref:endogenous retrovirus group K member 5 Gag polyprotein-like n=1 Tax=Peromyscus californicus insignis TaxID=564181 RepID=UPI0022A6A0B8|nr:endogenous retrovirus group K member 5 Gag polyprotein-like [Peromyscus californicus insignis]XP_052590592.1 endogenous retrovirus group K member 5 Gag polyprotein-like [Peromyscus californicus insignis]
MGDSTAKAQLATELRELLQKQGTGIKSSTILTFVDTIAEARRWFLTGGGLNIPDWEQVKRDLQKALKDTGPEEFPIAAFSLWRLVKDALLTDKVKVKEQLAECEQAFATAQEAETNESLKGEKEEEKAMTPRKKLAVQDDESDLESIYELLDEEEQLEREAEELQRRLQKTKVKHKEPSAPICCRPPPHNPYWLDRDNQGDKEEGKWRGVIWQDTVQDYPISETVNAAEQAVRNHVPLTFKEMKQLKEAVSSYGLQAPFTVTLFESFSASYLTPSDWQQLCHAALSGGDYLLWKSENHERCLELARINARAGQPQRNYDMLAGAGQYADIQQQILYDPATYTQIANAAVRAWKSLPNLAAEEQISKVLQGPLEPYADFVSWLLQLAGKIFGDSDQAVPVVKQLAYENANKYCKEALRGSKGKSLNDMLHVCKDIDGNHITGQVLAAAIRHGLQGMNGEVLDLKDVSSAGRKAI